MTMEKMTATTLSNILRSTYGETIKTMFEEQGETVLLVGNGKYAIPVVDANGDDAWVTVSVSVPKGSRDGDAYDGYAESTFYQSHLDEQAEKKRKADELKAQKQAEREAKKAERDAKKKAKEAESKE